MSEKAASKQVFLLIYEDTDAAKSVNSAYSNREVAEAWLGRLVEELLGDALLANEEDAHKINAIREMLEAGQFGEAAQAFNALQGDQVWIEDAEVVEAMPTPGQSIAYL
jgi:hypothetical protein